METTNYFVEMMGVNYTRGNVRSFCNKGGNRSYTLPVIRHQLNPTYGDIEQSDDPYTLSMQGIQEI